MAIVVGRAKSIGSGGQKGVFVDKRAGNLTQKNKLIRMLIGSTCMFMHMHTCKNGFKFEKLIYFI